jgi:hypothetical protein
MTDCTDHRPMIVDFVNDGAIAAAICKSHDIIDARTGKLLVNPDGDTRVFYADEATGLCRSYRHHYRGSEGAALKAELAKVEFHAPVRFVPKEGKEEMAAWIRHAYDRRQRAAIA